MRRHLVGRSTIGAIATLTTERPRGHGLFTFGDDGLPAVFSAERYHDLGNGESLLMTFTGRPSDFAISTGYAHDGGGLGYRWEGDGVRALERGTD